MTVSELIEKTGFRILAEGDLSREVTGEYCCDLLSIVMANAFEGCAWATVMSNLNSVAVASLVDMSCIILSGEAAIDENMLARAEVQGITVLKSDLPIFETALAVNRARNEN